MESAVGLYKSHLVGEKATFTGRAELERETAKRVHWHNTPSLAFTESRTDLRWSTSNAMIKWSPRPRWSRLFSRLQQNQVSSRNECQQTRVGCFAVISNPGQLVDQYIDDPIILHGSGFHIGLIKHRVV
uniref:Uncharacterized protein n=1 Tax=Mycobacterium leprae TaxID=1769 RepID=Q797W2_MYCLR|nr:hypothetical protein MLCL383.11c [Mycobacterium leprae]